MSERGGRFTRNWVSENINVEPYDVPKEMVNSTVASMVEDAQAEGITPQEIEEDVGDLNDFISEAYESRTHDEVERLGSRDD